MPTAQIYLDIRRAKIDGTFPVKIRIGNGKKVKLYSTTISANERDFRKILKGGGMSESLSKHRLKLNGLLIKANEIIEILNPFSFETFETRFLQVGNRLDLLFLLKDKSDALYELENYSNSNLYKQAKELIQKYQTSQKKGNELLLNEIDVKWLKNFEQWVISQVREDKVGNLKSVYSLTTLSMYLIRVRAIFNDALSDKIISANLYPFHTPQNNKGYKIPRPSGNKRALTKEQITKIFNYQPSNYNEEFAKDIFLFSYLACGMNCADIFYLRWKDIKDDQFTFIRRKTAAKLGGRNKVTIELTPELLDILKRHGSHKIGSDLIFNVIPENCSSIVAFKTIKSTISMINVQLKKIAAQLEITTEISTYFARHSFSTNMMNANVPIKLISAKLGHSSLKTTEDYLGDFTSDEVRKYMSNLLDKTSIA